MGLICEKRWSKIAKHLPGRTDNEIKNYWRTRIQKHIKQAENCTAQTAENDQASTSQVSSSCPADHAVESYSPPSFNGNMEPYHGPFPTESNESLWSMEDLWSLQLLNGDWVIACQNPTVPYSYSMARYCLVYISSFP